MPITVYCKTCGRKNNAPDSGAGKRGKCPACGAVMEIPLKSEEPPIVELSAAPEAAKITPKQLASEILNSQVSFSLPPERLKLSIGLLAIAFFCALLGSLGGIPTLIGVVAAPAGFVILLGGFPKISDLVRIGGGILAGLFTFSLLLGMFTDPKPKPVPSTPAAEPTQTQPAPVAQVPPTATSKEPPVTAPKPVAPPKKKGPTVEISELVASAFEFSDWEVTLLSMDGVMKWNGKRMGRLTWAVYNEKGVKLGAGHISELPLKKGESCKIEIPFYPWQEVARVVIDTE